MSKAAFVTGGSGFVGRNLIVMLREQGYAVKALARSDAAANTVQAQGAEIVRGDLDDESAMRAGMAGCEVVFHSAAKVDDWGDPKDYQRINVDGTKRTLDAAKAAGVKRFVHVSTEAVLIGGPQLINADETWPRPEHPIGLYPLSKGQAEAVVQAANAPDFTTVIMRPRFIWGKGDNTLLPSLMKAIDMGAYRWFNGGHHLTSTCHVRNVCEGLMLGAEKGRGGEIYFLTDGAPVEFRAFVAAMLATQGIEDKSGDLPTWAGKAFAAAGEWVWKTLPLKGRPLLTRSSIRLIGEEVTVNDAKARRELGYVGKVTREAGLAELRKN